MGAKLKNILITDLNIIKTEKGNIFHGLKKTSPRYINFGESYFSEVNQLEIKGWKKHNKVTLNICVPLGSIRFVIHNSDKRELTSDICEEYIIGNSNYKLLTIPPGFWVAFQGLESKNMLHNIIDSEHDPQEADNRDLSHFKYEWSKN